MYRNDTLTRIKRDASAENRFYFLLDGSKVMPSLAQLIMNAAPGLTTDSNFFSNAYNLIMEGGTISYKVVLLAMFSITPSFTKNLLAGLNERKKIKLDHEYRMAVLANKQSDFHPPANNNHPSQDTSRSMKIIQPEQGAGKPE